MGTTAQEGSTHRWPVKCIFFPDCWAGFNCLLQDLTLLLLNPTSSLIFQRNILQFASIIKLIIHPSALYCIPLSFELVCIAITLLTVGRRAGRLCSNPPHSHTDGRGNWLCWSGASICLSHLNFPSLEYSSFSALDLLCVRCVLRKAQAGPGAG